MHISAAYLNVSSTFSNEVGIGTLKVRFSVVEIPSCFKSPYYISNIFSTSASLTLSGQCGEETQTWLIYMPAIQKNTNNTALWAKHASPNLSLPSLGSFFRSLEMHLVAANSSTSCDAQSKDAQPSEATPKLVSVGLSPAAWLHLKVLEKPA